jgi:hypothetical protein
MEERAGERRSVLINRIALSPTLSHSASREREKRSEHLS